MCIVWHELCMIIVCYKLCKKCLRWFNDKSLEVLAHLVILNRVLELYWIFWIQHTEILHYLKHARIRVFTDPYSLFILENTAQWKPVFSHILRSACKSPVVLETENILKLMETYWKLKFIFLWLRCIQFSKHFHNLFWIGKILSVGKDFKGNYFLAKSIS